MSEVIPEGAAFTLRFGDNLTTLRTCAENSFDSCVVDPPYGLAFMGKVWDYDVPTAETWCEVMRVLKPGAHLLAFFGSRTYHRGVVQIEDAGFEIRDSINWIYGSGFPKSHNLNGDYDGWGTALKPAHEPIVVARKPLQGTVAQNMAKWGVGAIRINDCRVSVGAEDKSQVRVMQRSARSLRDGWGMAETENAPVVRPDGRWPANIIHDGSPEVLDLFPDSKGQQGKSNDAQRTRAHTYGELSDGGKEYTPRGDSGSAARFFYCAKASKSDRDEGLTIPEQAIVTFATANGTSGKPSSISEGRETAYRNNHPTVKPTELMRYLCRLVTPAGGIVLDPFMGSGSTGKACALEGVRFFGCEIDEGYFAIAQQRIANAYSIANEAAA
jgi:DNA modification methylase